MWDNDQRCICSRREENHQMMMMMIMMMMMMMIIDRLNSKSVLSIYSIYLSVCSCIVIVIVIITCREGQEVPYVTVPLAVRVEPQREVDFCCC